VALGGLFPWFPLLSLLRRSTFDALPARFAAAWFAWGFLFFSLSANKLPGYLLPLMPALCLLLGIAWTRTPRTLPLAASVLLLALVPAVAAVLPAALLDGLSRASWRAAPWSGLWIAAPAAALCAWLARRRPVYALAIAVLFCAAASAWLKVSTYPVLDRLVSARPLAAASTACPEDIPRSLRYGFNYYKGAAVCPDFVSPAGPSEPPAPSPAPAPERPRP
jgi:4-amino-4-deoxy-L-arabinose transferase-like glycosyltransferase